MIDSTKHVICHLISTDQVFLKHRLVAVLVDLLQEEALEVAEVLLPAKTSFEYAGYGEILDEVTLYDHGLALILTIPFLVKTDGFRFGAQGPKCQSVVDYVVVEVDLGFKSECLCQGGWRYRLRLCHPPWL